MRNRLAIVALVLLGLVVSPARAQAPPAAGAAYSDHSAKTRSGATFTAPGGWIQSDKVKLVEFTPPEGDLWLTLVDVESAADAEEAAATAWKLWAPGRSRPPKLITSRPARDGWDERRVIDYETSPNEKREMSATAYRAGKRWIVAIVDGNEGTAEKRQAAIRLVTQSLRPPGYLRETLPAGRRIRWMSPVSPCSKPSSSNR